MISRRTLIRLFIVVSILWLGIDILFILNPANISYKMFSVENLLVGKTERTRKSVKFEEITLEAFDILKDLGAHGAAAILPDQFLIESEKSFKNHSFNSVLSDKISLNRKLPDVRIEECKMKHNTFPDDLPSTTVIICFHNEAMSVLLRTVHSVLNSSPPELISEILLVDDASHYENLKNPLDDHVSNLGKVKVLRMEKREGLIRSRLAGSAVANGQVLTFLDSHCEVTEGWLEPLLSRIAENRSTVVCPVIDVINADDFSYNNNGKIVQRGGFTWDLYFRWIAIPENEQLRRKDDSYPIRTPTMAGGLFSIDKDYFYEIGSYDDGMDIWGGENLEMSFRIWMCGGQLEILPCSHVGHVFRKYTSPYKFPNGTAETIAKNFNRLAEVWMDDYKELYYKKKSYIQRIVNPGDISARQELRKQLHCKSFTWYLENIYPEKITELHPQAQGEIRNPETNLCVDSDTERKDLIEKIKLYQCHGMGGNQYFIFTKEKEIQFNDNKCLDISTADDGSYVQLLQCHGQKGNQQWIRDKDTGQIIHVRMGRCLDISEDLRYLVINQCDRESETQIWEFSEYSDKALIP